MRSSPTLKSIRQVFKACADDTRLRILHLLKERELSVNQMCDTLGVSQPTVSKHLARLRLSKIVTDRRQGNMVYYGLASDMHSAQGKLITFITSEFDDIQAFQQDKEAFRRKAKT